MGVSTWLVNSWMAVVASPPAHRFEALFSSHFIDNKAASLIGTSLSGRGDI